jgi:hypothetical protein
MKFLIPLDFIEAVENLTGEPFNDEQAHAVLQLLGTTAGGRLLLARILLPHFLEWIERLGAGAKAEAVSVPEVVS